MLVVMRTHFNVCIFMYMKKNTKIVATIGPASNKKEILKKLVENGVNVIRLNCSHGKYEEYKQIINDVRDISKELDRPVGILADIQGPRIRTLVESPVEMKEGEKILIGKSDFKSNDQKYINLDYSGILKDVEVGNDILVEDGLMKIKIVDKKDNHLEGEVVDGGIIKNHKGVNIPDANLKIPVVTEKDEKDLDFMLEQEVDFIGLSFVSSKKDIEDLKVRMTGKLGRKENLPQVVAKIERKKAIDNLDEIMEAADVVMVARGDLGIEIDPSKVAILQKEIIQKSLESHRPVIVATQMLNSMIENPRPTRAEVSDVSNAVIDHADAVMLSGESASGKYPVESVAMMKEIIINTEESPFDDVNDYKISGITSEELEIARTACELSKNSDVKAILAVSPTGFTARLISHFRPKKKLVVATNSKKTYNQLSVVWGAKAYLFESEKNINDMAEELIKTIKNDGTLGMGDKVVVVFGKSLEENNLSLIGIREV